MINDALLVGSQTFLTKREERANVEFFRYWIEHAEDRLKQYRKNNKLTKFDPAKGHLSYNEYMGCTLGVEGFSEVLSQLRVKKKSVIIGISEVRPWEREREAKSNKVIELPVSRSRSPDLNFLHTHLVNDLNNETLCNDRSSTDGRRYVKFNINLDPKYDSLLDLEMIRKELTADREIECLRIIDNHISFTLIETENGKRERFEEERRKYTSAEEISDSATALINGIDSERKEHPYMKSWSSVIWARGSDHLDEVLELLRKEVAKKIDQDEFEFVLEAKKPIWENPTFRLKLTSKS